MDIKLARCASSPFKRHRFPPDIIRHSVWLYAGFTLELPRCRGDARRAGPGQSYETVRRWFLKFGSVIAANLRRTRPKPSDWGPPLFEPYRWTLGNARAWRPELGSELAKL